VKLSTTRIERLWSFAYHAAIAARFHVLPSCPAINSVE